MTTRTKNDRRAMRVAHVLSWCKDWSSDREGMIDLLTDARHWCDRNHHGFADLDRIAHQHYLHERYSVGENGIETPVATESAADEATGANTNCLEGIACPACGNNSRFYIEARTLAVVTDDGVETGGDMEWDSGSYAECPECRHTGTVRDFRSAATSERTTPTSKEQPL